MINVKNSDSPCAPVMAVMQFFVLLVKKEVGKSMRIYRKGEGTECTIGKAVMRGCLISNEKTLKETLIKMTLWYVCHIYMYMNHMNRNGLLWLFLLIDIQQVNVVGAGLGGASRKNPGIGLDLSHQITSRGSKSYEIFLFSALCFVVHQTFWVAKMGVRWRH